MLIGMRVAVAGIQAGETPLKNAVEVGNFADDSGLKSSGVVKLGVPPEGSEKTDSLARGGDGKVAALNGGSLLTRARVKVRGKQMTLLLRARDDSGEWKGMLLAAPNPGNPSGTGL